jgi:TolA-binding protein
MFKNRYTPYFWIVGLGALTYIWTVFFGFIYFDDNALILNNLFFLRNLANIPTAFVTDVFYVLHSSAAYYRPLLTLSFMLDAQISGSSPFLYHLTNVVIHLVTSCVVFFFLQKIKIKKEISFIFSIIFTVLPVLAQTVAWIPARDDSLLTLFSLLSFIFFINFIQLGKTKDAVWHLLFLTAAIFTKESGLIIAPVIVLYFLLFEKKQFFSSKLNIAFAWIGIVGVWYILRGLALQESLKYTFANVIKSIYMGFPAVVLDLGKVFFPVNLSILPNVQDSTFVWGFIALFLIFVFLIFSKNKNYKLIFFGAIWFFAFLLPAFIRPGTDYYLDFFEYRLYLPIIGLLIILSEVGFVKKFSFSNKTSTLIFGALICLLIILNFFNTSVYRDRLILWQSAVMNSPHLALAHKNLGAMYYLAGDLDKAETEDVKTLELSPNEPMIHNNLGLIYAAKGDLKKAEEEYKTELGINPNYDDALYNYGLLLYKENRTEEAENMWIETLKVNPDYVSAIENLFVVYYQNKNVEKANYYYSELQKRGINLQ